MTALSAFYFGVFVGAVLGAVARKVWDHALAANRRLNADIEFLGAIPSNPRGDDSD